MTKPKLNAKGQTVSLLVISALVAVYSVLLVGNLHAKAVADTGNSFEAMDEAISMDKFEWADSALSYVDSVPAMEDIPEDIRAQADRYAERLERLDSNTVPFDLASYYFQTGRTEKALAMVEKYVEYVSSDAEAWQRAFDLILQYEEDTDVYRTGVRRVAWMLNEWNAENMGQIVISDSALALIDRVGG